MQAERLMIQADMHREEVTFCGSSISVKQARQLGLKLNTVGELLDGFTENCEYTSKVCPVCKAENVPTKVTKTDGGKIVEHVNGAHSARYYPDAI